MKRAAAFFLLCAVLLSGGSISWGEQPLNVIDREYPSRLDPVSDVYQNLLHENPDTLEALNHLQRFLFERRRYSDLLWLADMLVNKGELEKASALLQILLRRMPGQAGTIRFRIAEIHYFRGEFQQTLDLCQQLMTLEASGDGDYINNALERMVFVRENLSSAEPLTLFAATELLLRQQKYSEALLKIEQLKAEFPRSALADDLMLLESVVWGETGDFPRAIDVLRSLLSEHPESLLCPKAQKRLAEIYEERLQDHPAAEREYKLFLVRYPDSILASEIRGKLHRLRTEQQPPPF